jgi:phosphatidylglycerophosphatase A
MKNKFSFSTIIATFFGVGFIPFAPGTFGSIMAFPLYVLLTYFMSMAQGGVSSISATELINNLLVLTAALFLLGTWAADQYSLNSGKEDPKEVVIDEVVGQLLTICLVILLLPYIGSEAILKFKNHGINELNLAALNLAGAFILFRIFDITKPWPIDYIEKRFKGGFGIMIDDIAAAIFAVIMHFFILYAVIDRL